MHRKITHFCKTTNHPWFIACKLSLQYSSSSRIILQQTKENTGGLSANFSYYILSCKKTLIEQYNLYKRPVLKQQSQQITIEIPNISYEVAKNLHTTYVHIISISFLQFD